MNQIGTCEHHPTPINLSDASLLADPTILLFRPNHILAEGGNAYPSADEIAANNRAFFEAIDNPAPLSLSSAKSATALIYSDGGRTIANQVIKYLESTLATNSPDKGEISVALEKFIAKCEVLTTTHTMRNFNPQTAEEMFRSTEGVVGRLKEAVHRLRTEPAFGISEAINFINENENGMMKAGKLIVSTRQENEAA